MKETYKYHAGFLILLIIIVACITKIVEPGHLMNGDFALYIRQAECFINGDAWRVQNDMRQMIDLSAYKYYSPVLYPWGYPLLLSPIVFLFGNDYLALKILGSVCFVVSVFILYVHFYTKGYRVVALILAALVGLNLMYLYFCNVVLSELVYLMFALLTIFYIQRVYKVIEYSSILFFQHLLIGFLLFMSFLIRTEGLLLIFSLFAIQIRCYLQNVNKKGYTKLKLLQYGFLSYLFAGILFVIFTFFFPAGFLEHSTHLLLISTDTLFSNLSCLFSFPGDLLFFSNPFLNPFFNPFFWLFVLVGVWRDFWNNISELAYLVAAIFLFLLWPYSAERYWLSVAPFMIFFFLRGLFCLKEVFNKKWLRIVPYSIIFILVIFLGIETTIEVNRPTLKSDSIWNPDVEGEEAKEIFHFIQSHASKNDVIACSESRIVYLYTGLLSCNVSGDPFNAIQKVDWYISFVHRGDYLQYPPISMEAYQKIYKKVFSNSLFVIYKLEKK